MSLKITIVPHTLHFKFDARTSRGSMQEHQVYYVLLSNTEQPKRIGIGECAPLPGLSLEYHPDLISTLQPVVDSLNLDLKNSDIDSLKSAVYDKGIKQFSSLVFALETAILDFKQGGIKHLFSNAFTSRQKGIPINGLIWMGDKNFMQEQIRKKLLEGYSCLKLKIGGLDFNTELEILKSIRQVAAPEQLTVRLDANGAFSHENALSKLNQLAAFHVHSIEQPIRPGQWTEMQHICRNSPVPIALDEELIGQVEKENKEMMLQFIQPAYIILKPTLLGGFQACSEWISLAEQQGINWWITSALESNIGLNAISQFTAEYAVNTEQGLGTGQLYHNNISSPLTIKEGKLYYNSEKNWDLSLINL